MNCLLLREVFLALNSRHKIPFNMQMNYAWPFITLFLTKVNLVCYMKYYGVDYKGIVSTQFNGYLASFKVSS